MGWFGGLTVTGSVTPRYWRFTTATVTAGMWVSCWAKGCASGGSARARAANGGGGGQLWGGGGLPHREGVLHPPQAPPTLSRTHLRRAAR